MRHKNTGFTIVELLIVIVVIAILAAVSVVAYGGIQDRAKNTSRLSELKSWQKLFEIYKATYGSYPKPTPFTLGTWGYCLGTGYPGETDAATGAGGYCRNAGNLAYVNPSLNTELKKVGSTPNGIRSLTKANALGVYADYHGSSSYDGTLDLVQIFDGNAPCPASTTQGYEYTSGSTSTVISRLCIVTLKE